MLGRNLEMKKKSLLLLVAMLLAFSGVLAACGKKEESGGGKGSGDKDKAELADVQVLNTYETADMPSLNPIMEDSILAATLAANAFETLYVFDNDFDSATPEFNHGIKLGVAKSEPKKSEDGKTWNIELREDAKWSNGDPVVAQDFVDGWQYALENKSLYAFTMFDLKNAEDVFKGKAKPEDLGVTAVGDYELELVWDKVYPHTQALLSLQSFLPQNKKFAEEQGDKYGQEADTQVYNGPYVVDSWTRESGWVYKKNENYWNADAVTLETIDVKVLTDEALRLQLYEAGEIDRISLTGDQLLRFPNHDDLVTFGELTTFWLKLNQSNNEVLANVNARKAIARAFDMNAFINDVLADGSSPARQVVPVGLQTNDDGKDFRDGNDLMTDSTIEDAQAYWEKAKEEVGFKEVTLSFINYETSNAKKIGEYLQEELEKNLPGLKLDLRPVPFPQMLEMQDNGDYDIMHAGWGAAYPDAGYFLEIHTTGHSSNRMDYSNEEYDRLLKAANEEYQKDLDGNKRFETMQKAEAISIDEDQVIAPLYQRANPTLVNPKVEGFVKRSFGGDYYFADMRILK